MPILAGLAMAGLTATFIGGIIVQELMSPATSIGETRGPAVASALAAPSTPGAPSDPERPRRHGGATASEAWVVTENDGALPDGVTAFDRDFPGIANLDPDLGRALRRATTDAAADGISIHVNSGWRSRAYQAELLEAAVEEHGSEAEAARWVASADTSPHVAGVAADIGPLEATTWLAGHGAAYGLCQIYRNEPWHFEFRAEAIDHGCPRRYADPTRDPRLRQ